MEDRKRRSADSLTTLAASSCTIRTRRSKSMPFTRSGRADTHVGNTDSNNVIDLCDADDDNDTGGVGESAVTQAQSRTVAKPPKPLKGILKEEDDDVKRKDAKRRKKQLHFSEIMHEVFYYESLSPTPFEADDAEVQFIGESSVTTANAPKPSSQIDQSKATAEYTVLSSRHGRARREQRCISKHDLKTAIKYGLKLPGNPDPRSGEKRWKFIYKGLVYVTDAECKKEITSYRDNSQNTPPGMECERVDTVPITAKIQSKHNELVRVLQDEPHLITGHTMVIVDQSGSMRNSDVQGFETRSHAAYRCLGVDFIKQQLTSRDPDQADLFAEAVSVIEMRDGGDILLNRVPMDWILYNHIVDRPTKSRPYSHGNYNQSLQLASKLIFQEHSMLLKDGMSQDDMPNFSLVFLSDGRPSDSNRHHDQERVHLLTTLVDTLTNKFSFFAMGVGAPAADFQTLRDMVDLINEKGGVGSFVHTGSSKAKLSQSFSKVSSVLTSHRTTLLQDGKPEPKVKKGYSMRPKGKTVGLTSIFPSSKYDCTRFDIRRFRFDKDKAKGNRSQDPWKQVQFVGNDVNGVEVEDNPFGKGAERLAYRFYELKAGKRLKCFAAKDSLHQTKETKEAFHHTFCLVQSRALEWAGRYNQAIKLSSLLKPADACLKAPTLRFLCPSVYSIKEKGRGGGERKDYLVEVKLEGKFCKWNSNNGFVSKSKNKVLDAGQTIELKVGSERVSSVPLEEFVHAFTHWVYEASQREIIVCDLQGVLYQEGKHPEFILTDPAICNRRPANRSGKTDMGLNGIRRWASSHRCGAVCKGLNLPCLGRVD